jgi:hypothetical protein
MNLEDDMEKMTYYTDDERRLFCLEKGIDPLQHCCLDMAWFISEPVESESQGPNPVILWLRSWDEYRIDISRRGHSSTRIHYCPWCSTKLPNPKTDLWYETLNNLGYHDPGNDDIPEEFNTDKWWRNLEAMAALQAENEALGLQ